MTAEQRAQLRITQIDYALAICDWTPDEKAIWASIKNAYRHHGPEAWGRQNLHRMLQVQEMICRAQDAHLQR
jgi:hypothetical protein